MKSSGTGYRHEYQLTKFDYGLTLFGITSFTSGLFITRSARKEMKQLGNRYNVNYQVRPNKLVTRGIYRFSRHPIYLGVMLMVIGGPLSLHSAMVPLYKKKGPNFLNYIYAFWTLNALAAFAFFDRIEIPREEQVLRDTFGRKYTEYKDVTSKWVGFGPSYNDKRSNTCNANKTKPNE